MAVAISQTATPSPLATVSFVATYSATSIGVAASDRIVAVTCYTQTLIPISATIDSGGGPLAMNATTVSTINSRYTVIFYLLVPSNTLADIKITFNADGTNSSNKIVVFRVTGGAETPAATGVDTSSDINSDALRTGSIGVPSDGGFLGSAVSLTGSSFNWTNATESIDNAVGSSFRYTAAIRVTTGTVNITAFAPDPVSGALSWMTFNPAGVQSGQAGLNGAGNLSVNTISAQQISAIFSGAGNLRGALSTTHDQFGSSVFGGSGNFLINIGQRTSISARFVGGGNLSIGAIRIIGVRSQFVGSGALQVDTIHIQAPLPPDLTLHVGEWPVALPECPVLNGFSEQRQRNAIEFQPEVGFTKLHRRATTSVMQTSVTFRMTDAEVDIFNEWYVDYQDDGTLEFTWDHPVTKVNYLWMFDAQDAPKIERMTPDTFRVSFNLLRLD